MELETLLGRMSYFGDVKDMYGSTHFPIYNTATFDLKKAKNSPYEYSRWSNPTRKSLENIIAKAENAFGAICVNSGISSIYMVMDLVVPVNGVILAEKDLYGGTFCILSQLKESIGVKTIYADFTNLDEVEKHLRENKVSLVHCESITNPALKVLDLEAIGDLSKKYKAKFSVDNSMLTFAGVKPLDMGADFSMCSGTKYLTGHGALVCGTIATKSEEDHKKIEILTSSKGATQSPMDTFVMSLGIPSLPVRMQRHQENAMKVATFLESRKEIKRVKFPGLKSHPQHELAKKQLKYFSGVVTIDCDSEKTAQKLIDNTKLFGEKASFGTSDSRMEMPINLSHKNFTLEELKEIDIFPSTLRISIGLENTNDLINDLKQALDN